MTADLRTRIAAVLRNMTGDLTYEAMADAVIRELGLRLDSEHRVAHYVLTPPSGFLRKFDSRTRWVTTWSDWTADESDTIPHCKCGHNARPHTDTHCHQCDCTKLTQCECGGMGMPDDWTTTE